MSSIDISKSDVQVTVTDSITYFSADNSCSPANFSTTLSSVDILGFCIQGPAGPSGAGSFASLTDTPATITANAMVVGNASGNGLVFEIEQPIEIRSDIVSSTVVYKGWAKNGAIDSEAKWYLEKYEKVAGVWTKKTPNGNNIYSFVWNDRQTYIYL